MAYKGIVERTSKVSKIIIHNDTDMSDIEAMWYILDVMREGRVSNFDKQYCYATRWSDGTVVLAGLNKNSDRFVVYKEVVYKEGEND